MLTKNRIRRCLSNSRTLSQKRIDRGFRFTFRLAETRRHVIRSWIQDKIIYDKNRKDNALCHRVIMKSVPENTMTIRQ